MRIALNLHQFIHLHLAVSSYPSHIVAPQVNQHDVLGPLFGISKEFRRQGLVFGLRASPGAGPGNGPHLHRPVGFTHQQFRR